MNPIALIAHARGPFCRTLQAKLDAFKADFEAGKPPYNVPPSVIGTMHRATDELIAAGLGQFGIAPLNELQ